MFYKFLAKNTKKYNNIELNIVSLMQKIINI